MNKKTFMIQAVLSACCIITSCSSDTVNGDNEYFTHGQITYVQEDESKIFFFDNQDDTAMVTYNRKYPIQLNDNNQAKLTTYAGEVTIPETFAVEGKTYRVTSVDEMAFANNTTLTKLTLPESITAFGKGAFTNCSALTDINIPSTIQDIPSACFAQCKKMAAFTMPEQVKTIGNLAFANCANANKIELNEGITTIGERAFLGCSSIKEITLPSTVCKIGGNAFYRASKLTKIHCKATTPPALSDSLGDYISKATLFVPTGSKSAYEADKLWSKFNTIEEE
jgi:hypothetical protein